MVNANRDVSLGEFVKRLAARLQENNVALPLKNQEPWHVLFYDLTKTSRAGRPKFFDELVFDWDSRYPKCQELSEFLSALHFTANASARNPRFDVISVQPAIAERWARRADQDDPDLRGFVGYAVGLATKEFTTSTHE
jgi:hypothetical protein